MVSLEQRVTYQSRFKESPKLAAFQDLLIGKTISKPKDELNEIDEIYYGIINSIQGGSKSDFDNFYKKKSKSNPNKESPSPFVNDDFLIFCFIVGVVKFDYDKTWIKNIVSIRNRSSITISFENILNEAFTSNSNLSELILVFLYLTNQSLISNEFLGIVYKSVSQNVGLFEAKNDMQIICSIRAYDLIIEYKESDNGGKVKLLKDFEEVFLKKIKVFAWILQTIIILAFLWGVYSLVSIYPNVKAVFDGIGSVMKVFGLLGISQIGNLIPKYRKLTYELSLKLFGYPKSLIKSDDAK